MALKALEGVAISQTIRLAASAELPNGKCAYGWGSNARLTGRLGGANLSAIAGGCGFRHISADFLCNQLNIAPVGAYPTAA